MQSIMNSSSEYSGATSEDDSLSRSLSDSVTSSPPAVIEQDQPRPKRAYRPSTKLRDNVENIKTALLDQSRIAIVKCSQTGSQHKTKLSELSTDSGETLTLEHFTKGSNLMLKYKGKEYAVQFVHFKDESDKENIEKRKEKGKQPQKGRRGPRQRENEVQGLPRKLNTSETLNLLTNAQKKRKLDDSVRSDKKREEAMITTPVRTDKANRVENPLGEVLEKLNRMENTLAELVTLLKASPQQSGVVVKAEQSEDEIINGRNVMRLPARDAYAFALLLMDAIFSKEELSVSLLYKSDKSKKPGLDEEKVKHMMRLVEKRFGEEGWNEKTLISKANQKCRDSKPIVIN